MELASCRFEGNVRQWSLLARRRFRPSVPWCFAVSESLARTSLWSCFDGMGAALWSWFLVGSEVRHWSLLARRRFRPSVPWCFAAETDRDRQSQTETDRQLGRQPGRQADKQAGREAGKEAGRQADRQTGWQGGRQAGRQTGRQAGRQTDRQPSARSSFRSCFEGVGAALWSWFLVGSERDVRHWGPLPAGALRPSGPCAVPWCFAVSEIARWNFAVELL